MARLKGNIFIEEVGGVVPGQIEWDESGYITALDPASSLECERYIFPGFIDEHVHGIGGDDFMDADPGRWMRMDSELARHGVTSYLATTLTAPFSHIRRVIEESRASRSEHNGPTGLLGIHLEGPFIDRAAIGAQPLEEVAEASLESLVSLVGENSDGWIRLLTWAPNLPESDQAISWLTKRGIQVNLGHSLATYEAGRAAVDQGANGLTHFFNAMSPLQHREPGLVGLGLMDERVWCELIADGIHVRPEVVRYVMQTLGHRVLLVTDAMAATDMSPGSYTLGGFPVTVADGAARLADGTLAGSVLTMDQSLRNLMAWGMPLASVVRGMSTNAAARLGLDDRGRLRIGSYADIVVMDSTFSVLSTYRQGHPIY